LARDKIIVVDVEATCWQGYPPKGQCRQIIEIGICFLDIKTHKISDNRSILVKPSYSKLSEFCTELTSLTQEVIDKKGIPLVDACSILKNEYNSNKCIWASYGDFDKNIFNENCRKEGVKYPFSKKHINVKLLFGLKQKLSKDVGMARALKMLDIPLKGKHHRGVDDSFNIAHILATCL